ncbi:hypothetical protein [Pedobacter metabolipauper]|uniref:Viral A-type inclusion protein n=1 Tax=Pedobacter metabolipauper TaxID=425513 RepID=A0A4R6SZ20_9SPHI|nr:hypothetical protein [Pedobacter metabolipauper]TDQ11302.1 hypothetical protein ATK78_0420 [Pedobacter metabolipauper]
MKKLIGLVFILAAAIGCTQKQGQKDYKSVRDEVMQFHDSVMADHNKVVSNQMKLDTLLKDLKGLKTTHPEVDTLQEKVAITALISDLGRAEDRMNDWMHKFEPDVTGKSNEVAVQYFENEKAKVAAVDSLYKKEIKSSDAYLNKFKRQ